MGWDAEVIVVGGGLAGSATALALARAGHDVLVLERAAFPRSKVCGEGLMPHGVDALRRAGADVPVGSRPFRGIRFTSGTVRAEGCFPGGERGMGVQRLALDRLLLDLARSHPRVEVREQCAVRKMTRDGTAIRVSTAGADLRAPLIVGADGLHSQVRTWAGLGGRRFVRRRYGVRAHFRIRGPDPEWVDVYRLAGGELYVTPVGPGEINVAALCEHDTMASFRGDAAAGLRALIDCCPPVRDGLADRLPSDEVQVCGPLRNQPRDVVNDGVMLVGDAAGFLDGITGEGMSIGLVGAEIAAEVGAAALRAGRLERANLTPYARRRRELVRDIERIGRLVLWGIRSDFLTGRALRALARRPHLFDHLLAVEAGRASLGSVGLRGAIGFGQGLLWS